MSRRLTSPLSVANGHFHSCCWKSSSSKWMKPCRSATASPLLLGLSVVKKVYFLYYIAVRYNIISWSEPTLNYHLKPCFKVLPHLSFWRAYLQPDLKSKPLVTIFQNLLSLGESFGFSTSVQTETLWKTCWGTSAKTWHRLYDDISTGMCLLVCLKTYKDLCWVKSTIIPVTRWTLWCTHSDFLRWQDERKRTCYSLHISNVSLDSAFSLFAFEHFVKWSYGSLVFLELSW